MASFDILLINVRSDTPTSFFFPVSNTAFLTCGWAPLFGVAEAAACLLLPARLVTAYRRGQLDLALQHSGRIRTMLGCWIVVRRCVVAWRVSGHELNSQNSVEQDVQGIKAGVVNRESWDGKSLSDEASTKVRKTNVTSTDLGSAQPRERPSTLRHSLRRSIRARTPPHIR